MKGKRYPL